MSSMAIFAEMNFWKRNLSEKCLPPHKPLRYLHFVDSQSTYDVMDSQWQAYMTAFIATLLLQSIPSIQCKGILLSEIKVSTWFEVRYKDDTI